MFDHWPEVSDSRGHAWLKRERLPRKIAFVPEKPKGNLSGQMRDSSAGAGSRHG